MGCFDSRWTNESWSMGNLPMSVENIALRDTVVIPYGGYIVIR